MKGKGRARDGAALAFAASESGSMDLRRVSGYWPFGLLCAVLSTRWLLADAWPGTVSRASSEAVAAAVAGVACWLMARVRKEPAPAHKREYVSAAVAGALLFSGLQASLLAGSESPRASDLMIALALTPAVIAVALVARSSAGGGLNGADVGPGMIAPAGLLLMLPQPRFSSVGEVVVLLGAPLCAGLGAVWLCADVRGVSWRRAAAAFGGAALVFAAVCLREPTKPALAATALDFVVMMLTLWSLARLGARRYAGEFAVVPFLLLLEGYLLVRVWPEWKPACGLVMLLVAAVLLLRRRGGDTASTRLFG